MIGNAGESYSDNLAFKISFIERMYRSTTNSASEHYVMMTIQYEICRDEESSYIA